MPNHKLIDYSEGHVLPSFQFKNQSVREHAIGFTNDDLYKVGLQVDNQSFWVLTGVNPAVWSPFGDPKAQEQRTIQNLDAASSVDITHSPDPNHRRIVQIAKFIPGTSLSDTSLDFDLTDESLFTQENGTNGTDINGQLTLHNTHNGVGLVTETLLTDNRAFPDLDYNVVYPSSNSIYNTKHYIELQVGESTVISDVAGFKVHQGSTMLKYFIIGASVGSGPQHIDPNDVIGLAINMVDKFIIFKINNATFSTTSLSSLPGFNVAEPIQVKVWVRSVYAEIKTSSGSTIYAAPAGYSYGLDTFDDTSYPVLAPEVPDTPTFGSPVTVDNPNAYDTSANDHFGNDVAISSSYVAVCADYEDDASGANNGKVYVFNRSDGSLRYTLDDPNPVGFNGTDNFGKSIGITDTHLVTSAYWENVAGSYDASGNVYVFDIATGNLLHTIANPNVYGTYMNDYFGAFVAVSDNYFIASAIQEDNAGGTDAGVVYVFDLATANLVHTLQNTDPGPASDWFGESVAITDTHIAIGTERKMVSGVTSGRAYIYDTVSGSLLHTLDNPNVSGSADWDQFGKDVGLSSTKMIVGAASEDVGGSASGSAYIFDLTTGNLLHTLTDPNTYGTPAGDYFGQDVAISESYALVSAINEDDASGTSSGKVYIFDVNTGALLHTFDNPNAYGTSQDDNFGNSIDLIDEGLVVAAMQEDDAGGTDSGKAYIYSITPGIAQPAIVPYYVHTNLNQLDLTNVEEITSVTIDYTEPANTEIRALVSFNGRITWNNNQPITDKSNWSTIPEIITLLQNYTVTGPSLDWAFLLSTTDQYKTPSIDQITVNYREKGTYKIGTHNFTVELLSPTTTRVTNNTSLSTIKVNTII